MAHFRDLLKEKNFLFLWLGQIISNFGDRLNQMALIALVYHKAPGSTYELAKLLLFIVVPVFIIGPVAGAYVDRWNRKHIMVISDISRGILVLLIPLILFNFKSLMPVYLVVFFIFSITRFFLPSKLAIIPSLVSKDKLLIANSLTNTTYMIATIASLALAGVLIKLVGVIGSFFIDSETYFLSAILLSLIKPLDPRDRHSYREDLKLASKALEQALRQSVWNQIKEGIKFIFEYKKAKFIMGVLFALMAGAGAIFCVSIVYIQEAFGSATADLGFLGVFLGIGLLSGALAYGRFGNRLNKRKVVYASFILGGIGISVFTIVLRVFPYYRIIGLLSILVGAAISPVIVSTNTLMHEAIPDQLRGRIFSSQEMVIHLAFLIFMFISAILAEYIGRMWVLIGCGCIFSLIGISGFAGESLGRKKA
ncbi:MAG: MFS transporter [Candidatus Omnitrophota bacterium]